MLHAVGNYETNTHLVSQTDGSPVEDGVLRVVGETVVENEVEICLELLHSLVCVTHRLLAHGEEVHRVFDVARVVGNLQCTSSSITSPEGND